MRRRETQALSDRSDESDRSDNATGETFGRARGTVPPSHGASADTQETGHNRNETFGRARGMRQGDLRSRPWHGPAFARRF